MGHFTSDGEFIPSKLEAVQMEKNRLRNRARISEHSMRRVRAAIDSLQHQNDTEIVEAVIDTIEWWEQAMAKSDKCGAEMDEFRCGLPVGHKHRHVGYDGENHRKDWSNAPEAAEVAS